MDKVGDPFLVESAGEEEEEWPSGTPPQGHLPHEWAAAEAEAGDESPRPSLQCARAQVLPEFKHFSRRPLNELEQAQDYPRLEAESLV